jgi:hypothetical protein
MKKVDQNNVEQPRIDTKDIEKYKIAIEYLAKSQSKLIFPNESALHAAVVLGNMLQYSEREVRISDGNLKGDIADLSCSGFQEKLNAFINSDKRLSIIVTSDSFDPNSEIYKSLKILSKEKGDRFVVKKMSTESTLKIEKLFPKIKSFAIGDDKSFRLEVMEQKNEGQPVRNALCSFNRHDIAERLLTIFDMQLKLSEDFLFE